MKYICLHSDVEEYGELVAAKESRLWNRFPLVRVEQGEVANSCACNQEYSREIPIGY